MYITWQVIERGLLCDVYVTTRSNLLVFDMLPNSNTTITFYFLSVSWLFMIIYSVSSFLEGHLAGTQRVPLPWIYMLSFNGYGLTTRPGNYKPVGIPLMMDSLTVV